MKNRGSKISSAKIVIFQKIKKRIILLYISNKIQTQEANPYKHVRKKGYHPSKILYKRKQQKYQGA